MRIETAGVPAEAPPRGALPSALAPRPPAEGPSAFARLLRGLTAEIDRGESVTRAAMGAAQGAQAATPAQLLALQADVYRYSEALDLAARLVDRTTTSIKTVLQGQ